MFHQRCLKFLRFLPWNHGKLSKPLVSGSKASCLAPNKRGHTWLIWLGRIMTKLIPATCTQVLPAFVLSPTSLGDCSLLQVACGLNLEEWQASPQVLKAPFKCAPEGCLEWLCSERQPRFLVCRRVCWPKQAARSVYGDLYMSHGVDWRCDDLLL